MKIYKLSRELMIFNLDSLMDLEKYYSKNKNELWTRENFLLDLPMKWELSQIAIDEKLVGGYIICSKKTSDLEGEPQDYYFVHRTFINPSNRNSSLLKRFRIIELPFVPKSLIDNLEKLGT